MPKAKGDGDWRANLIPIKCGYCGEITNLFNIKFGEHKCKSLIPIDNNFTSHNVCSYETTQSKIATSKSAKADFS